MKTGHDIKHFLIIIQNMSKKVALISGITGQDGSFLAEFLIEKDTKYMVS